VPYYTDPGHSAAGDVDGDGIPEALIEMTNQIKIIKAFDNDSFYVWKTISVPFKSMWLLISDLDNNGINDIIVVGHNKILVYEWSTYVEEKGFTHRDNFFKNNIIISLFEFRDKGIKVFDVSGRTSPLPSFKEGGVYFIRLKEKGKTFKIIKIR